MVSDHVFYPQTLSSPYPYSPDGKPIWSPSTPWPDPRVLIGAMAAEGWFSSGIMRRGMAAKVVHHPGYFG